MEGGLRRRPSGFELADDDGSTDGIPRSGSGMLVRTLSSVYLDATDEANPPGVAGNGKRWLTRLIVVSIGALMLGVTISTRLRSLTPDGTQLPLERALLELVVPSVGSILTWILAFSPIPTLLQDRHYDQLSVDPTPFPAYFTATFGWCIFAAVTADPWPFIGNMPPMLSFLFCTLSALRLCKNAATAERLELLTITGVVILVFMILLTLSPVIIESRATRTWLAGAIAPSLTFWQAMAPSIEAVSSIRNRDASLLSLPLSVAGMLCSSFWTIYGCAVQQPAIWVPNGTLFGLSGFNLVVKICVGSAPVKDVLLPGGRAIRSPSKFHT